MIKDQNANEHRIKDKMKIITNIIMKIKMT